MRPESLREADLILRDADYARYKDEEIESFLTQQV